MTKFALVTLLFIAAAGPSAYSQALDQQKTATVHIYRNGSHGVAIQVMVDGAEIFKLDHHQMKTFALTPGRHEFSARYARQQPTVTINTEPGVEYFFQVSMEIRRGFAGMPDPSMPISLTLTQQRGVLNPSGIHEEPLSQDQKEFIAFKISQARSTAPAQIAQSSQPAAPHSTPALAPAAVTASVQVAAVAASQPPPMVTAAKAYSVKYAGGSIAGAQVGKPLQLQIDNSAIQLGRAIIPSGSVTGITLSQDKHHRIGTGIAVSMVTLGAGVPIMFSKSTKDFIQITWDNAGAKGGAAFQADKNEYRGILAALEGVTGKTANLPVDK